MTSVPPEPPAGSDPSATPPTPPAQQWTTPPAQPAPSGAAGGFDFAAINKLDWGILGAGLLTFIFSFFSYYSFKPKGAAKAQCKEFGGCSSVHWSAWHGFFGWFAVLVVLIATIGLAVHLFAPQVPLRVPVRLTVLGAFTLALLCVLLALAVVPDYSVNGVSASGSLVNKGHSFGYWLSLIVILAGAVLSFLRLRATGGKLPWEGKA